MSTVTTVTTSERDSARKLGNRGAGSGNGRNGGGGGPRGGGNGGNPRSDSDFAAEKYRIGIWVILAGVAMMFTALTSAYIVRSVSIDGSRDWQPITMPRMLIVSTALILVSSVTFYVARKALLREDRESYRNWLTLTGALGIGFLTSQLMAWRQLVEQGVYLATNPHSSFFYLLTAMHGLHLVFGLLALGFLVVRAWRSGNQKLAEFKKSTAGTHAMGIYWHFMDGLWIYLFLLLFVWR